MRKISIVVGLGAGDEGKGMVTASLVREANNPIVVRFNGGHQAGHTVIKDGHRHVFSSFGSGTLHGAPTYWSKYCTVDPVGLLNEFELLKDFNPQLYIDPLCPITTWLDKHWNKHDNTINGHGSVGVGFGQTLQRNQDHYTLYAKDLKYPSVLKFKIENIWRAYGYKHDERDEFFDCVDRMLALPRNIIIGVPNMTDDVIFEGAQGVLLDQRYGFFPNVTRSNTTSMNAMEMLKCGYPLYLYNQYDPNIYMVTRAYQTRHGAGPLLNEGVEIKLKNNENETNVKNYQGEFRVAPFSHEMFDYAIECEELSSRSWPKTVVMTCCDQVEELPSVICNYKIRLNYNAEGDWL